jgi:hypothetical protein
MNKLTTEKFIIKANKIHKNKYNYSKTKYLNFKTNVIITCNKHGDFLCKPCRHIQKTGCQECYKELNRKTIESFRMSKETFIKRANKKHKNKYSYEDVAYVNSRLKVKIVCQLHGEFYQEPFVHLRGHGCPACGFENSANSTRLNTKDFIKKAIDIHNNIYDYSKANYISAHKNLIIVCRKHGEFKQTPNSHLRGSGCPSCCKNVSLKETKWLDSLNIPKEYRQYPLIGFKVDGFDPTTKTVYEFNGDFWHGNPKIYDLNKINIKVGITFGELYKNTLDKEETLVKEGYKVVTMWESDFQEVSQGRGSLKNRFEES